MGNKKYKSTPFARLFIVLLFATPLAYIGASYYNGEDGIENIKNLFGINQEKTTEIVPSDTNRNLEEENDVLMEQNKALKKENKALKKELEELKGN